LFVSFGAGIECFPKNFQQINTSIQVKKIYDLSFADQNTEVRQVKKKHSKIDWLPLDYESAALIREIKVNF